LQNLLAGLALRKATSIVLTTSKMSITLSQSTSIGETGHDGFGSIAAVSFLNATPIVATTSKMLTTPSQAASA
jgi:hypothetical protein